MSHEIIYSERYIEDMVDKLAFTLNTTILSDQSCSNGAKCKPTLYVCILKGGVQFFHDVTKRLPPGYCHYIVASSYHRNKQTPEIKINIFDLHVPIEAIERVIIFDDICDSGVTLQEVVRIIQKFLPVAKIHTAVLLHRLRDDAVYKPNFSAIEVKDRSLLDCYFAGYGLDNDQCDRNLPYIYGIHQDL